MKYSYKWLQEHIKETLPPPQKLAETLTMRSFEVEGIENPENDTVLDIKVLPNRAPDCLSHRGMAREIAAIFSLSVKDNFRKELNKNGTGISVSVKEPELCRLYLAGGVTFGGNRESPGWLKERLKAIGQRPINLVVDIGNFVMFDIGQPIHAFDRDKVDGEIIVRKAEKGEKMTTLDGKDVIFGGGELVIADKSHILGIAGIKGGKVPEVTGDTKNLIIEAANFSASSIRTTSEKLGIKTDASRRFENGVGRNLAVEGMEMVVSLLKELGGEKDFSAGPVTEAGVKEEERPVVSVTLGDINRILGSSLEMSFVENIFRRLRFSFEKEGDKFSVIPPPDRLDIKIREDLVEEVGRLFGFENLGSAEVSRFSRRGVPHKRFHYGNHVRKILTDLGFSEIYTYTFVDGGDIELQNPMAEDKWALRKNLHRGMKDALLRNCYYAPFLGIDTVKVFELGRVFENGGEHLSLCLGISGTDKKTNTEVKRYAEEALSALAREFPGDYTAPEGNPFVFEINADKVFDSLPEPEKYESLFAREEIEYKQLSVYPFVLRDISLFVPAHIKPEKVEDLIRGEAGELLVRMSVFDRFEKEFPDGEKKVSYAFRLVFQSFEKTLTDDEVGRYMDRVTKALNTNNGWHVR